MSGRRNPGAGSPRPIGGAACAATGLAGVAGVAGLVALVALVALVTAALAGLTAAPVAAQQVAPAVEDLRDHDVTFEDGALSASELDELDEATAELQDDGGYLKVVVLAEPVSRYDDARAYGDEVLGGLGGDGRVLVITPNEVGVASNVDPADEVDDAERAAADALGDGKSLSTATTAAADRLGVDGGGGGGGGMGWLWLLLLVAIPLLVLFLLWRAARRMRRSTEAATAEQLGAAEATVRAAVDKAANDLLELNDRIDLPDTPVAAREAYSLGAEAFTRAQELLEGADTRPELERAYPTVVEAGWHLDTARALLDGRPAPPKPEPEELFPAAVVVTGGGEGGGRGAAASPGASPTAPAPEPAPQPHYQRSSSSPWITAAAMAAMAMLSQRGMRQPRTRPSMDDGAFGSWMGGLPPLPSSSGGRGGGWFGGGGRQRSSSGGGRRGGGGFMTSGQRRRGMGRRA